MAATYRSIRDLDWTLLVVTLIICSLGILQLYSATRATEAKDAWWKQIAFLIIGFILMLILAQIDYHAWLSRVPPLYIVSVLLLIVTFVAGQTIFGSRRWIPIFGMTLQVSEFVKIVIILLTARYLTDIRKDHLEGMDLLRLGALVGIPFLLVNRQPDLGTSLTYLPIVAGGVFIAGIRWQHAAVALLAVTFVAAFGWFVLKDFVFTDYQKARITTFLDPEGDPKGRGYQSIQSKIAVGNGGVWGQGVTRGSQTQLRFLPVSLTDFLFAAFAEEHGFVGVAVALGLYFVLIMQTVQSAQMAPDRAGLFICVGVASLLLFHVLVNAGMIVGRLPVVGIPLPLMSSGGSSLLTVFIMLGLVQSVRLRRFVN